MKLPVVFVLAVLFANPWPAFAADDIDFNRDVRPILSDKCYACHGPDAKSLQGELRLDRRDGVTAPAKSGKRAIVPGSPATSELARRIQSTDPDEAMPPPDAKKPLTATEKELLVRWIAAGAVYQDHWSFLRPVRRSPPPVTDAAWNVNGIDQFVYAALANRGMTPSPEADRLTLIRRVSLDLRGLPPTLTEIDAFAHDAAMDAYERMVDRMLAAPQFGERMAMIWMDLARYGDTNGFHADSDRPVWLWRDWVVDAYNANMPFDQFTIWQLAGDLLPEATADQRIASGFNRNVRFNEEGGADPEEFLTAYAADRAITMGRVWLGLTLGCAQCHSHKYDPVTQREFYQLTAFFNSLEEVGAGGVTGFHGKPVPPVMRVATRQTRNELAAVTSRLERLEREIERIATTTNYADPGFSGEPVPHVAESQSAWEAVVAAYRAPAMPAPSARWNFVQGVEDVVGDRDGTLVGGARITAEGLLLDGKAAHVITAPIKQELRAKTLEAWVKLNNLSQGGGAVIGVQTILGGASELIFDAIVYGEREPGRWLAGSDYFRRTQDLGGAAETEADKQFVHVAIAYDEDGRIRCYRQGKPYGQPSKKGGLQIFKAGEARLIFGARALPPGQNYMLAGVIREARMYDRALSEAEIAACAGSSSPGLPDEVLAILQSKNDRRSPEQSALLRDYYLRNVHGATLARLAKLRQEVGTLRARSAFLADEQNHPLQMVSVELPKPRPAYVLVRGDFQSPGEQVERAVPRFLPPFPADQPRNRLGLARWLMRADQPLVARVQVNRFWQMLFGEGLTRSLGDFGLQGSYPTHPELLDWLAIQFIDSHWDVKRTLKLMLMSRTYRQASRDVRRYAELDPQDKLLWRAPRVRLQAEIVRDNALAVAGLLSDKLGGPPVFPYQPADYYKGKNNGWRWPVSQGDDLYRRGMYAFWRRTTPYPSFVIFDAPDRAECTFERPRTNTPLQALVTLNDPQFIEAARVFAQRILLDSPADIDARVTFAYRRTLARPPSERELAVMREFVAGQLDIYRSNPEAAQALIAAGSAPRPAELDRAEHAAWTAVANVLLNLDETITRN